MKYLKTVRKIRILYIIALITIALLVTSSFFTMQHVVSKQRGFSKLINLAGHQSGLCNRITYFISVMAVTDDETEFNTARAQVGRSMHRMRDAHQSLMAGNPEKGISYVTNENLQEIYQDQMLGLDKAMNRFLEKVKTAYETDMETFSPGNASYIYITTYGPHVLGSLLDAAVDEYESIGREAIVQIERFETIIWVATLLTLLIEFTFIFRPLERRVKKALISLELSVETLDETRRRLMAAQHLAQVGDWEMDIRSGQVIWSDQVSEICGVEPSDTGLTFKKYMAVFHPDEHEKVENQLKAIGPELPSIDMECRIIRPDGSERLVYQEAVAVLDKNGKLVKISGIIQDITERKALSTRLERLSEHIPGFIFQFQMGPDGHARFLYAGKGIRETCGIERDQVLTDASAMFELFHDEDMQRVRKNLAGAAKRMENWSDQYRIRHPEKGLIWLEGHATPEKLGDGGIQWYGYIWDITERRQAESQIRRLALYDPLTGLANRRLLKDRVSHAIANSRRTLNFGAVIMLDMDNFKALNDTRGHNVGDALLIEVARRLQACVRETDTIARLGGDEFVVVLEWLSNEKERAYTKATEVAQKIRKALNANYSLEDDGHVYHASASVGVALFRGGQKGVSEMLKRADVAMYEAKELGRNRVCFYSEVRQAVIDRNSKLAHDLQTALERDEFSLYLQPQLSGTGQLCGAEALIRWTPPGKDPVSPGAFIPVAESTGLILPIGEWVLKQACVYLLQLSDYDLPEDFSIAVNISARQFSDERFVEKVGKVIAEQNIDTRRLKLELTETSLVRDLQRGKTILTALRDMGLSIELDDFGTGYSSLNALNNLPLNTLKIDRSLINGVETDKSSRAIVRAVIAMAKAMSLGTIAEGVETQSQMKFLISEGCDLQQGFLHARPMPYEDFLQYLDRHAAPHKDGAQDSKIISIPT